MNEQSNSSESSASGGQAGGDATAGTFATEFHVGSALGLVSATTFALVDTNNGELGERLWALISDESPVDELLEELSATGLRSLGSFALARLEDGAVRVVVRGEAVALVLGSAGEQRVDAGGVKTWSERVVDGAESFSLAIDGEPVDLSPYRSETGVLPARSLKWPAVGALSAPLAESAAGELADFMPPHKAVAQETPVVEAAAVAPSSSPVVESAPVIDDLIPAVAGVADQPESHGMPASVGTVDSDDERGSLPGPDDMPLVVDTGDTLSPDVFGEDQDQIVPNAPETEVDASYDELYGETVARSVQAAAVEPVEDADPEAPPKPPSGLIVAVPTGGAVPPPEPSVEQGDHDGHTIGVAQLRAMRSQGAAVGSGYEPAVAGGPTVQAVICSAGHPNPPQAGVCRVCGAALNGAPVNIKRPSLGTLTFTTGETVELLRPLVVGRNPKVEGQMTGEMPQMFRLDAGGAISRTHLMVRIEGWQVLIEDRGSANGTSVSLPGRQPLLLRAGEPMLIEPGATIDIGGEVTATYNFGVG